MDEREKELIYEWACGYGSEESEKAVFSPIDRNAESYFVKRDNQEEYLHEYGFQTLSELRTVLEAMWQGEAYMNAVMKPVLVGAMKNRIETYREGEKTVSGEIKATEKLQPYIYNF